MPSQLGSRLERCGRRSSGGRLCTGVGFEVRARRVAAASPEQSWAMLGRIGQWWDPAHTYSGKSGNLSLASEAGGCFCETIPSGTRVGSAAGTQASGGVIHGRVLMALPYETLTLDSGLGPILSEGASGPEVEPSCSKRRRHRDHAKLRRWRSHTPGRRATCARGRHGPVPGPRAARQGTRPPII